MPPDAHRLFASIVIAGVSIASSGCSCAESHEPDAGTAVDAPVGTDGPGADAPLPDSSTPDAPASPDAAPEDATVADAACEGCEPCSSEPRCEMCFPCIL